MEKLKKYLTKFLIAFALISIGFAMGKHSVKLNRQAIGLPAIEGHQVVVYYLHSTFRCSTCNTIEKMALELVNTKYSDEVAAGKMHWVEDDFQENEALARKFEVVASCVVVAEMKDGEVIDYKRLDEVWTLIDSPGDFNKYLSDEIDMYLSKIGGES